jgi:hypothetical protein
LLATAKSWNWRTNACSHCYEETSVIGYQARIHSCYLFVIAHKKLEQWEKNHGIDNTWQSGHNKKHEANSKAKLTYSKKKVHNPFGEAVRKMPNEISNDRILS